MGLMGHFNVKWYSKLFRGMMTQPIRLVLLSVSLPYGAYINAFGLYFNASGSTQQDEKLVSVHVHQQDELSCTLKSLKLIINMQPRGLQGC